LARRCRVSCELEEKRTKDDGDKKEEDVIFLVLVSVLFFLPLPVRLFAKPNEDPGGHQATDGGVIAGTYIPLFLTPTTAARRVGRRWNPSILSTRLLPLLVMDNAIKANTNPLLVGASRHLSRCRRRLCATETPPPAGGAPGTSGTASTRYDNLTTSCSRIGFSLCACLLSG
jgi:hypothetical protein